MCLILIKTWLNKVIIVIELFVEMSSDTLNCDRKAEENHK